MKVVWLNKAKDDLKEAVRYVREDNPQAAGLLYEAVRQQVKRLADFPESARPGRVEGTRELVVTEFPYIVAYYIKSREVRVLAVLHTSRKWPDTFSEE